MYESNGYNYIITDANKLECMLGNGTTEVMSALSDSFQFKENLSIPPFLTSTNDCQRYKVSNISQYAFYKLLIVSVKIPFTIKIISHACFAHCYSLEEIIFEDGIDVQYFGPNILWETKIKRIIVPVKAKTLNALIFNKIDSLEEIFYCGRNRFKTSFTLTSSNVKVYVPINYPSNKFGNLEATRSYACPPLSRISCNIRRKHAISMSVFFDIAIEFYK